VGDGYRIIAPSKFGYLRSPLPADGSHVAQAETLAALLDARSSPDRPVNGWPAVHAAAVL
jgi:2-hydroxy-6-oxonona-2,4-dienedioate hydrolase